MKSIKTDVSKSFPKDASDDSFVVGENQQNESVIQNHTIECHERRLLGERN